MRAVKRIDQARREAERRDRRIADAQPSLAAIADRRGRGARARKRINRLPCVRQEQPPPFRKRRPGRQTFEQRKTEFIL